MIYRVQIPIPDYLQEDWTEYDLFFEGSRPPTQEEVIQRLNLLHEEYKSYSTYDGCELNAVESVKKVEEWPPLYPGLASNNSFTHVTLKPTLRPIEIVRAPLTLSKLTIYPVEQKD